MGLGKFLLVGFGAKYSWGIAESFLLSFVIGILLGFVGIVALAAVIVGIPYAALVHPHRLKFAVPLMAGFAGAPAVLLRLSDQQALEYWQQANRSWGLLAALWLLAGWIGAGMYACSAAVALWTSENDEEVLRPGEMITGVGISLVGVVLLIPSAFFLFMNTRWSELFQSTYG